ncbi:hypothetical protein [Anaerosinus massiliensis]|uniref:hypothetical protein n=1 Tax=Massilibacillus massiliensis TaxID=1806837 RepID=UPI000DA63E55|nr:hypothetical protein [Massilibacillus massiliensis]
MVSIVKRCKCIREIMVTLGITVFIFFTNPIYNAYHQIFHLRDDMGVLGALTITTFVFIEACFIRLNHYWKWIVVSNFIFSTVSLIGLEYPEVYTSLDKFFEIIINYSISEAAISGSLYLIFAMPPVIIVYHVKKFIRDGSKWKTIKAMPLKIILIPAILESWLIWFIYF